ncbi:MAG: OmpA family protein [Cytophagales bacterium]|nr:OmpA family protein [Cytophagales bacterium]MDW8384679.1 OmpA family protein [Flammeovirgaceae bacterium]
MIKKIVILLYLWLSIATGKAQVISLLERSERPSYRVLGYVFGEKDKKPKSNVVVLAYSLEENESKPTYRILEEQHQTMTDADGRFSLELYGDTEYMIHIMKDGFSAKPIFFNKKSVSKGESISIEVMLSKAVTYTYQGMVLNIDTREPIENAEVVLYDLTGGTSLHMKTKQNGQFNFLLENNKEYRLEVFKSGYYYYIRNELTVKQLLNAHPENMNVYLEKILVGKRIVLDYYPFEINDDSITKEAEAEMIKLYKLMLLNPHINIEIGCHTDARGDDAYNEKLSQSRAEAARNYLIRRGIHPKRITAKGYGEKYILNECTEGVKCSNEKHLENRRLEYIVTEQVE